MTEARRPGRPPAEEPNPESARVEIRMTPAMRKRIRLVALQADVSMAAWVKMAIEEKLVRDGA